MVPQPKIILHQFPISHFCEKVRLALTLKNLEYEVKNHLPGLHMLTVRKISGQNMVPVLVTEGRIIPDSNRILHYLDETYAQTPLYPRDRRKAAEIDKFIQKVDAELGVHLRRTLYDMILPDLGLLIRLLAGSGFNRREQIGFRLLAPLVRILMRKSMRIRPEAVERSRHKVTRILDQLDERIGTRRYFFGGALTAADVTVAALIAPVVQPDHYPVEFPQQLPEDVVRFREACRKRPVYKWAEKFYAAL